MGSDIGQCRPRPSLATMFSSPYECHNIAFCFILFQKQFGLPEFAAIQSGMRVRPYRKSDLHRMARRVVLRLASSPNRQLVPPMSAGSATVVATVSGPPSSRQ